MFLIAKFILLLPSYNFKTARDYQYFLKVEKIFFARRYFQILPLFVIIAFKNLPGPKDKGAEQRIEEVNESKWTAIL